MMLIHCDTVAPQRWKNGGGSLRELLLRPDRGEWRLRIALAPIDADGPSFVAPTVAEERP